MNEEYKKQVDELNKIYHAMLIVSNYKEIEAKFSRIQTLSTTELRVLRIISENDDVIIKDIIDILKVPKSTLTNIINRLEKRNLIKRAISDRDKRSYKLELTHEGTLTQKEHIEFENTIFERVIGSLDTYDEREEFLKLIRKIVNNISKASCPS